MDDTRRLRFQGRLYAPVIMRNELLERYHDAPTAGHGGNRSFEKRLGRHYFWESVREDITAHIANCLSYARTKARTHRPYGELAPLPVPEGPWQDITVDFVTGLPTSIDPRTNKPCDAILVIVDKFTKYALYVATRKTLTASAFADLMLDHVYRPFGLPSSIVSDRGSLFTSHFWKAWCKRLAVEQRLSTAYHPQTDGQTERQNQVLEHYLRTYCSYDQADWAQRLILAEHAYNTSYHSATRTTPAYLLMGYQPRQPADPLSHETSNSPAADERAREMVTKRGEVRALLQAANEAYAKHYNKKRTPMTFAAGQWVWLSTKYLRQRRPSRKLADKYLGPFRIIAVVGDKKMAYKLDLPQRYRIHHTFPISLLEPFKGDNAAAQEQREVVDVEPEDQEYEVEAILAHRGPPRNRQFLVQWQGFGPESNSWEPEAHINDGPEFRAYQARLRRAHLQRGH